MEKVVMKASRTDSGYCCACDLIPGWVVAYTGGIDGFKDWWLLLIYNNVSAPPSALSCVKF